jgi:hypothetical protein
MSSNEFWKTISTHPNFQVSNLGRIRNQRTGKRVKGCRSDKHVRVVLDQHAYPLAYLVLVHFVGARPPFCKIAYTDGNLQNCCVDNLNWCNYNRVSVIPPKRKRGNQPLVDRMNVLLASGMPKSQIADELGVCRRTLYNWIGEKGKGKRKFRCQLTGRSLFLGDYL